MGTPNVLTWRRKPAAPEPVVGDPSLLWTMRRDRWLIDCVLQDCGRRGWTLQVQLNGLTFFRSSFRSWEDAIESAEDRYAALVHSGWTPVPLSRDDEYRPL